MSHYKYLGVIIDDRLQWSDHVKITKAKINKKMYFLRKLTKLCVDKILTAIS